VEVVTERDGRFALGPLAPALRALGTARLGLESYHAWGDLPHTLRTGTPAFDRVYGKRFYEYIGDDPRRVARWDDAMVAILPELDPGGAGGVRLPGDRPAG
jgi:hypothetical protein